MKKRIWNDDKHRAHGAIWRAVSTGKIPRAKELICVDCGRPAQDYDHYLGHDRTHYLDVQPVCKKCHAIRERDRGASKQNPCTNPNHLSKIQYEGFNGNLYWACFECHKKRDGAGNVAQVRGEFYVPRLVNGVFNWVLNTSIRAKYNNAPWEKQRVKKTYIRSSPFNRTRAKKPIRRITQHPVHSEVA